MAFKDRPLNIAFATAAENSSEFRDWLLNRTKLGIGVARPVLARGDNPWSKSAVNGDDLGETDILIVFEPSRGGNRVGLHIENKLPWDKFRPDQLKKYKRRASEWVGIPKWGTYHSWQIGVIAPTKFYLRNRVRCDEFDWYIGYEEIAPWIPAYGQYC